jgi:carboxylesterase
MVKQVEVIAGAEEFAFGEGPVGALLVHGLTGSPQGMRSLGQYLTDRGIAVAAPRLPGHGTTWQDLNARKSEEWVEAVETAHESLAARTDEVFLVGLSFGAALSLDLAARRPGDISGVVALASFLMTKDPRRHFAPLVRLLVSSLPGVSNDIADPNMREIAYDRLPTSAVYSMFRYLPTVRARLKDVTAPVLIVHSRNDHTAHPENASLIFDSISSADKRIEWLKRSYHVITIDYDRDHVAELTMSFIQERAKHAL